MTIYHPKRRLRVEHELPEQIALFQWARKKPIRRRYPALDLLSCSLNGVKLTKAQAGKARAAGMLSGEHDVKLPVARGPYIGLSIELKAGDNRPTSDQLWYGQRLQEEGWSVQYCWGWLEAKAAIESYLAMPKQERNLE